MSATSTRSLTKVLPSVSRSCKPLTRSLATVVNPIQKDPTELDQVTTLSNGIRVATEDLPGAFSGVGVYIDAGSRYEDEYLRGASHIMDRLAFKSTSNRTSDQMIETLESLGGNIQCASSRESLMYQAATFNSAVPTTLELLADTIRNPLITEEEVVQQLDTAAYEIGEIWSKPELILPELVHMAAYKDNALGNPLLCPKEKLPSINKKVIETYRKAFLQPERMVLAFAGVQHREAVRLTEEYFGDMKENKPVLSQTGSESMFDSSAPLTPPPTPPQQPSKLLSRVPFFKNLSTSAPKSANVLSNVFAQTKYGPANINFSAPSRYTGGFLSLAPLSPPVNPTMPPLTHIHIAFESLKIDSEDIYAAATLQTLLGGGGSFSAGGPGKGMYSRLYTNVLNQHGWVESCVAFNHGYTDSGLFGISAACSPGRVTSMLEVMCQELQALTLESGYSSLQFQEVDRAKNQLRSSLLMNLESRMVELEDLGRQVQHHGKKTPVKEMCAKIDSLTIKDLRRVAKQIVNGMVQNAGNGSGAPTVVLQEGQEDGVKLKQLKWAEIQDRIARWKLGRR